MKVESYQCDYPKCPSISHEMYVCLVCGKHCCNRHSYHQLYMQYEGSNSKVSMQRNFRICMECGKKINTEGELVANAVCEVIRGTLPKEAIIENPDIPPRIKNATTT